MSCIKDEDDDEEYIETLKTNVITATCHLVTTCHASGQHHEGFHQTIEEGNKMGCLVKRVYVWSCSSMIWTLGGPPHISWLTMFLSCIQYVAFFKFLLVFFQHLNRQLIFFLKNMNYNMKGFQIRS